MVVKLITHTPDPEKVVAAAAKLCYSNSSIQDLMDGLTDEKVDEFLNRLSNLGHASPTEHVTFTFGIEGVSRSLLAQITRHRIASFSVQSQRYVRMNNAEIIIPDVIDDDSEAREAFKQAIQTAEYSYKHLCQILEDKITEELMVADSRLTEKKARVKASKIANENARSVLPNACSTKMIVTMNARSLNNFFNLRCCERAQPEIKELATEMLKLVYPIAPHLFKFAGPNCCGNGCTEGMMSCGKFHEIRDKYDKLKQEALNGNI